ncbi:MULTISPECIES: BcsE family c-di-GMP-binding protein [unclassified Caballeronia]|uniref:BcsE family c-di-GMP-binding protein n=1 Tax=unclassified Caballeronia TaxID=2646786 RepID=UPI002865B145|nr:MULTISPECIES: BcsE family c-di-GMP-binding protein [unclassified Caballeronia]MDR5740670.1 BcsE family c-di-GMP-binding protein [Caballeronia sp. LZ016]MDR5808806.1 BcsE family c-di-GMP-binding protein [Caballeronia sp. LZ019]
MNDATCASYSRATKRPAGWLAGLRATVRRLPRAGSTQRLVIDGLPEKWSTLARGAVHGIYTTPGTRACDALIWNTARKAGAEHVTVVRALAGEEIAAQLRARGLSADERAPGWPRHLNVLAMPPDGAATPLRAALRALCKRGLRSHSLSIIEGAERWFSWDDPAALGREGEFLARWCAKRAVSMILVFRAEPPARAYASSETLHVRFAGVARMGELAGELRWHVDFWRTGQTLVANETCALRLNAAGALVAEPESPSHGRIPSKPFIDDEHRVVIPRALVNPDAWFPGDWELHADNASVFAACGEARAASVFFTLDAQTSLAELCTMIHARRLQCGGALKIAVVERSDAIALNHELLLLRVGADAVLADRDLSISRLLCALRSLQGHVHTGATVDDPAAAFAAAQPDGIAGYAPLARFCDRVAAALQRSAPLALPHVLVELTLGPDVSHLDALCATLSRQPGRLATVDATRVYLFLFACEPPDAQERLAQMLGTSGAGFFAERRLYAGSGIAQQLDAMRERARRVHAPDYSDVLPIAPAPMPRAAAGGGTPSRVLHWAPVAGAAMPERELREPRRAERCTLPIRREVDA